MAIATVTASGFAGLYFSVTAKLSFYYFTGIDHQGNNLDVNSRDQAAVKCLVMPFENPCECQGIKQLRFCHVDLNFMPLS